MTCWWCVVLLPFSIICSAPKIKRLTYINNVCKTLNIRTFLLFKSIELVYTLLWLNWIEEIEKNKIIIFNHSVWYFYLCKIATCYFTTFLYSNVFQIIYRSHILQNNNYFTLLYVKPSANLFIIISSHHQIRYTTSSWVDHATKSELRTLLTKMWSGTCW